VSNAIRVTCPRPGCSCTLRLLPREGGYASIECPCCKTDMLQAADYAGVHVDWPLVAALSARALNPPHPLLGAETMIITCPECAARHVHSDGAVSSPVPCTRCGTDMAPAINARLIPPLTEARVREIIREERTIAFNRALGFATDQPSPFARSIMEAGIAAEAEETLRRSYEADREDLSWWPGWLQRAKDAASAKTVRPATLEELGKTMDQVGAAARPSLEVEVKARSRAEAAARAQYEAERVHWGANTVAWDDMTVEGIRDRKIAAMEAALAVADAWAPTKRKIKVGDHFRVIGDPNHDPEYRFKAQRVRGDVVTSAGGFTFHDAACEFVPAWNAP
jgi:hypothetical protein